jgi:mono/diheme cytochrome c family protein
MQYIPFRQLVALMALSVGVNCVAALAQTSPFIGFGKSPTQEDMGNVAWTSGASGHDLPPGQGTAKQGAPIFMAKCSMCHGRDGEGVKPTAGAFSPLSGRRLAGGNSTPHYNPPGTPPSPNQITTMAYTIPWATPIFNTIAVEMPFFNTGTLKADEVYALTAWVLFKNGLIKEDEVMDRNTLPKVQMPNRNAFPASDDVYLDMKKRGCIQTAGVCTHD